ncbi:MAG: N-acetylmuramoyl-L-alanine amidase [Proteobacteria bacterium]|nr:N-acetylmuramoyl-L-alanine amidase [Pseudomonadota bacterium]
MSRFGIALALLLAAVLIAPPALTATVEDIRVWRAPDHTRLVLDVSEPLKYSTLELDNPERIVVDMINTTLKSSTDLALANTPIKAIRTGVRAGSNLRLVLDLTQQVRLEVFTLSATEVSGDRLVIDLFDLEPKPRIIASQPDNDVKRDIVVAIDAGHGGEDPGALGPGNIQEKKVVFAIAQELRQLFANTPGFRPVMIRTGDYYVSLAGRRKLAREAQADIFISIHADAFTNPQANGASVFALSLRGASSTTAQYLAQRENAADLVGGVTIAGKDDVLASVLTDLSMTSTRESSMQVGSSVLGEMKNVARLHKPKVEQAGFAVLKSPDIVSILVETGFISNPTEARRLANSQYRQKMANAIFTGVKDYFYSNPIAGTLVAWQKQQGGRTYTITRGDTLSGIAQRFKVSEEAIRSLNNIQGSRILVGQTLVIPRA